MKKVIITILFCLVILSACSGGREEVEGRVYCEDPRPEICASLYDPVCGDNGRDYANSCKACIDLDVDYSDRGMCEQ